MDRNFTLLGTSVVLAFGAVAAHAKDDSSQPPSIPTCDKKIGTLAVTEPENSGGWQLQAGVAGGADQGLRLAVQVLHAAGSRQGPRGGAEKERALAGGGEMRGGSNIGKGQMKAADYVLVPDIVNKNGNSGGTRVGGMLGGCRAGGVGVLLGGISLKSKTADVVLTLTDVRSTEQVSPCSRATPRRRTWAGRPAAAPASSVASPPAGASSYANTEIGQVVTMAYLDAFMKLVNDVKQIQPNAKADNVSQSVTMAKPGKMYERPDLKAQGRARPGSRHDAVPDAARRTGHLVEGHRRAGQRGLGALDAVPAREVDCRLPWPQAGA